MGKISPVAAKYIVKAEIITTGVVEKPDIIGAVFGQTEGLLGADLELRELQKSGRIGRIEVKLTTRGGKTSGIIELPSSMDKAETAIVASALETIDRIGPCEAKVKAISVEDVREVKRKYIIDRAKGILKDMLMTGPDSQEILEEITDSVRQAELTFYGFGKLPAGPAVASSDEVIIVEGRADVLTLLRNGMKNAVAIGGNKISKDVLDLSKKKIVTLFVDGDRGGDLIVKEFLMLADIDYVAKAPDGKEVEELTKKEIHKALRGKEAAEQVRKNLDVTLEKRPGRLVSRTTSSRTTGGRTMSRRTPAPPKEIVLSDEKKESFKKLLDDLVGTKGAYLLRDAEILGKVPTIELGRYLEILKADTVVMDGSVTRRVVGICKNHGVDLIVGKRAEAGLTGTNVVTLKDLEGGK
ncbi:MAG: DNA primase [Candidatus Altiarchaeota archaeon]|nr:DNA primase [Candidatus Altiarchaeota archaeon]